MTDRIIRIHYRKLRKYSGKMGDYPHCFTLSGIHRSKEEDTEIFRWAVQTYGDHTYGGSYGRWRTALFGDSRDYLFRDEKDASLFRLWWM